MTMAQAQEILQTWRECMDEQNFSESSDPSDKVTPGVEFVPSTGIQIKEIIEEEPAVEYFPHPSTSMILADSEDEQENEDEIDLTH